MDYRPDPIRCQSGELIPIRLHFGSTSIFDVKLICVDVETLLEMKLFGWVGSFLPNGFSETLLEWVSAKGLSIDQFELFL